MENEINNNESEEDTEEDIDAKEIIRSHDAMHSRRRYQYRRTYNCYGYKCKGTTKSPTQQPNINDFCDDRADGQYAHPTRCDAFISCVARVNVYVMDCPAGLHYDAANNRCEFPERANCNLGKYLFSSCILAILREFEIIKKNTNLKDQTGSL